MSRAPSKALTVAVRRIALRHLRSLTTTTVADVLAQLPADLNATEALIGQIISNTPSFPDLSRALPKTVTDFILALPSDLLARIASIDDERCYEGNAPYWIYTRPGFGEAHNHCHTLTAYSIAELKSRILHEIAPCDCPDCLTVKEPA